MSNETFRKGDRVKMSAKGIAGLINRRHPERLGVIMSPDSTHNCMRVLWDGTKTPQYLHRTFVTKTGEQPVIDFIPHRFYENDTKCIVCGLGTADAATQGCRPLFEVVSLLAESKRQEANLREALATEFKNSTEAEAEHHKAIEERNLARNERDDIQSLWHALAAQAHEIIAGKVPPDYVPQTLASEMLQHLHASGMGKPGAKYGNTLWSCIHEAVDNMVEMRAAIEEVVAWDLRVENGEEMPGGVWLDLVAKLRGVLSRIPKDSLAEAKEAEIAKLKEAFAKANPA